METTNPKQETLHEHLTDIQNANNNLIKIMENIHKITQNNVIKFQTFRIAEKLKDINNSLGVIKTEI